MNAPCYGCADREPLCHDRCERYLEYRESRIKASRERIMAMLARPAFKRVTESERLKLRDQKRGK